MRCTQPVAGEAGHTLEKSDDGIDVMCESDDFARTSLEAVDVTEEDGNLAPDDANLRL